MHELSKGRLGNIIVLPAPQNLEAVYRLNDRPDLEILRARNAELIASVDRAAILVREEYQIQNKSSSIAVEAQLQHAFKALEATADALLAYTQALGDRINKIPGKP